MNQILRVLLRQDIVTWLSNVLFFFMSAAMFPACWHGQERVPSAGASGFLAGFSGEV